jgi:hypothetical protein
MKQARQPKTWQLVLLAVWLLALSALATAERLGAPDAEFPPLPAEDPVATGQ